MKGGGGGGGKEEDLQCKSVIPATTEVSHFNLVIACCLTLTPQQQALFGSQPLDADIRYCEPQDQRPYQPEYDFSIAIHHILSPNVRQGDMLSGFDE